MALPRHFSRMMQSPSFRNTKHFQEESSEMLLEKKIEAKFFNIIYFLNPKHWIKH